MDQKDKAVELLAFICHNLEGEDIPCPPELLEWYAEYKKGEIILDPIER